MEAACRWPRLARKLLTKYRKERHFKCMTAWRRFANKLLSGFTVNPKQRQLRIYGRWNRLMRGVLRLEMTPL